MVAAGLCAAPLKWERTDRLAVRDLKLLTAAPRCWQMTELRVDVKGTYITPFDADEIAVMLKSNRPAAALFECRRFFYQEFASESGPAGETEMADPVYSGGSRNVLDGNPGARPLRHGCRPAVFPFRLHRPRITASFACRSAIPTISNLRMGRLTSPLVKTWCMGRWPIFPVDDEAGR